MFDSTAESERTYRLYMSQHCTLCRNLTAFLNGSSVSQIYRIIFVQLSYSEMRLYGITTLMFDDVHTVIHVHSKVSDSFKVYVFDLIDSVGFTFYFIYIYFFFTIPH